MENNEYQSILCEHCSAKLRIKSSLLGKTATCPKCRQTTRLAVQERTAVAQEPKPARRHSEIVSIVCPSCGGPVQEIGNSVECRFCGNLAVAHGVDGAGPSNKLTLADIALAASNPEEAYRYYTEVLESNPKDPRAWFGKGVCALQLSTLKQFRIQEAIAAFEQAITATPSEREKKTIRDACDAVVASCTQFHQNAHDHCRKFISLPNSGEELDARLQWVNEGFEWVSSKMPERDDFYNVFLLVTGGRYFYHERLQGPESAIEKYRNRHQFLLARLKEKDPDFHALSLNELSKKPCFVVTAASGSEDHAAVIELRQFRDRYLTASGAGQTVCSIYHRVGPVLAAGISSHWLLRKAAFALLVVPMLFFARFTTARLKRRP